MLSGMDKKSKFLLLSLIIGPIFIIFLLIILRGCSSSNSYSKYEKQMLNAAKKYFENKNMLPVTEGGNASVSLDDLVNYEYIKSPSKELKDESCSGTVSVYNNGASVKENNGGFYLYIPDLKCDSYKTEHLIDKLLKDVVTSKSGLYETSDGYVYKGSKVKNYISFFEKKYLIISIDNSNILKVVKIDSEKDNSEWDYKFNTSVDYSYGKNDYSDSYMLDVLTNMYLGTDIDKKKHMVAHDVCYGNRNSEYYNIDNINECSKKLDNQFITLMNVYDYPLASYDSECVSIYSGACSNYNYIFNNIDSTWLVNGITDDSYDVYYFSGSIDFTKAYYSKRYNIVLYLNGNELYTEGNGTYDKPYVIK